MKPNVWNQSATENDASLLGMYRMLTNAEAARKAELAVHRTPAQVSKPSGGHTNCQLQGFPDGPASDRHLHGFR